jgi:hypothetical protein
MIEFNTKYFNGITLKQLNPKRDALSIYRTSDNIIIGIFQGKKGKYPELDFIVRILQPGSENKPFPPEHNLWVVDLILKISNHKKEVQEIIEFYIDFYNNIKPFEKKEERINYNLKTRNYIVKKYSNINQKNTLSIEYVSIILELFCINEKRNDGAYMFINLLKTLYEYTEDRVDYITVMRASKAGY